MSLEEIKRKKMTLMKDLNEVERILLRLTEYSGVLGKYTLQLTINGLGSWTLKSKSKMGLIIHNSNLVLKDLLKIESVILFQDAANFWLAINTNTSFEDNLKKGVFSVHGDMKVAEDLIVKLRSTFGMGGSRKNINEGRSKSNSNSIGVVGVGNITTSSSPTSSPSPDHHRYLDNLTAVNEFEDSDVENEYNNHSSRNRDHEVDDHHSHSSHYSYSSVHSTHSRNSNSNHSLSQPLYRESNDTKDDEMGSVMHSSSRNANDFDSDTGEVDHDDPNTDEVNMIDNIKRHFSSPRLIGTPGSNRNNDTPSSSSKSKSKSKSSSNSNSKSNDNSRLPDYSQPLKRGWLLKKGDLIGGWRARYFNVFVGHAEYFVDQQDSVPRGIIPLHNAIVHDAKKCTVRGNSGYWMLLVEAPDQHGGKKSFRVASEKRGEAGWIEMDTWAKVFSIAADSSHIDEPSHNHYKHFKSNYIDNDELMSDEVSHGNGSSNNSRTHRRERSDVSDISGMLSDDINYHGSNSNSNSNDGGGSYSAPTSPRHNLQHDYHGDNHTINNNNYGNNNIIDNSGGGDAGTPDSVSQQYMNVRLSGRVKRSSLLRRAHANDGTKMVNNALNNTGNSLLDKIKNTALSVVDIDQDKIWDWLLMVRGASLVVVVLSGMGLLDFSIGITAAAVLVASFFLTPGLQL